jgi:hypothetical protein
MIVRLVIPALLLSAIFLGGCGPSAAKVDVNPMRVAVTDAELIRFHVADLLEEMFFVVEHPPRNPQRVDTRPLTSAHWFEFWRPDTRTARDACESSLHTIRRQVVVHLTPVSGDTQEPQATDIEVVVTRQRLSLAQDVEARSMHELYSVYQDRIGIVENLDDEFRAGAAWEHLGRDPALEQYILTRLSQRL